MANPNSPINPFDAARAREPTEITVMWTVEDIHGLKPEWTRERCERFLQRHANYFARHILRAGLLALAAMAADPNLGADPGAKDSEKV